MESVQEYDEEPGFNLDEFVDTNVDEVFDQVSQAYRDQIHNELTQFQSINELEIDHLIQQNEQNQEWNEQNQEWLYHQNAIYQPQPQPQPQVPYDYNHMYPIEETSFDDYENINHENHGRIQSAQPMYPREFVPTDSEYEELTTRKSQLKAKITFQDEKMKQNKLRSPKVDMIQEPQKKLVHSSASSSKTNLAKLKKPKQLRPFDGRVRNSIQEVREPKKAKII